MEKARLARAQKTLMRPLAINGVHYATRKEAMEALAPRVTGFSQGRVYTGENTYIAVSDITVAALEYLQELRNDLIAD